MKISLKAKLVSLVVISVVGVSLIVGLTSFFVLKSVFEDRVYAQLQSVTVLKEGKIRNFVDDVSVKIEYIANNKIRNTQFVSFLKDKKTGKEGIVEAFKGLNEGEKKFSELFILDTKGEVLISSIPTNEGKLKTNEEFFLNSQKMTYIQEISYDVSVGGATMLVGTPIKNANNELVGVLAATVNVGEINKLMLERSGLGKTGESVLINSNNLVITDLLKEPNVALKKTIFNPQITKCLEGNTFWEKVSDYHGDEVYGYYLWYPAVKSCIATKVDTAEVLASLNSTYFILFGIAIGVAVIAGIFGYFFGNKLFKPLKNLRDEVKKINEGNFDVSVIADTNDELSEVANAFNEMAQKLKVSYSELENKVSDKTQELENKLKELEKMNDLMVGRELTMIELKKKLQDKENG